MKISQILLLALITVPFIEIFLLLQVGSFLGVMPTVLLVVFTAFLGAWLLRQQGFATWRRFQACIAQGQIPAYEIIEGPIVLLGGVLLLTPGFFTDALGFVCLIPQLRRKLAQYLIENHLFAPINATPFAANEDTQNQHQVLEGEFSKKE